MKENLHVYMTSSGNTSSFYNNARLHDYAVARRGKMWILTVYLLYSLACLLAFGYRVKVECGGGGKGYK